MTDEYEEAVELMAVWLQEEDDAALRNARNLCTDMSVCRERAEALLSLTWPSGQPVIGVISQDQALFFNGTTPQEAMTQMYEQGFRRVIQEAKK